MSAHRPSGCIGDDLAGQRAGSLDRLGRGADPGLGFGPGVGLGLLLDRRLFELGQGLVLVSDARIDEGVRDVDEEVGEHVHKGRKQRAGDDHGQVAIADRLIDQEPDTVAG